MPSSDKAALKIHVDQEIKDRLEGYANKLHVSMNWLCEQAIREYLDSLPPLVLAEIRIVIANGD